MLIHLHSQAATTLKVRAEIQASDEPAWVLAERYGTTEPQNQRRFEGVMAMSSLTVSLAYASETRRAGTSSTNSAPNWTLSIVSPHQDRPKPMAWSKGSTDASRTCCKATTSDQARNWRPRCTAILGSTTSSSHNQH